MIEATKAHRIGLRIEFRDGEKPSRPYRKLALLTDDGALGEQGEIEQKFVKEARKMGANALIYAPLMRTGEELVGFAMVHTYLFKAQAVVYSE